MGYIFQPPAPTLSHSPQMPRSPPTAEDMEDFPTEDRMVPLEVNLLTEFGRECRHAVDVQIPAILILLVFIFIIVHGCLY